MPNIATVLKSEISRLAKKEAKAATTKLQQASVQYRADIANLKRLMGQQAKELQGLRQQQGQPRPEQPDENARFSARSVKAQRKRLGLSALDFGKLVGVSGLTIYSWESGKSRPIGPIHGCAGHRQAGGGQETGGNRRAEKVKEQEVMPPQIQVRR